MAFEAYEGDDEPDPDLIEISVQLRNSSREAVPFDVAVIRGDFNGRRPEPVPQARSIAHAGRDETSRFLERLPPGHEMKLRITTPNDFTVLDLPIRGGDKPMRVRLDDGVEFEIEQHSYSRSRRPPVDDGVALLEPITVEEFRATEGILAVLWEALDRRDLSAAQQAQIIAMAGLIESERNDTMPGETKRHRLVGAVGSALRYLAKEAPKDVLAWWKLADILHSVDWHTIASHLSK